MEKTNTGFGLSGARAQTKRSKKGENEGENEKEKERQRGRESRECVLVGVLVVINSVSFSLCTTAKRCDVPLAAIVAANT